MSTTSLASTHEVLNVDELLARCMGNRNFATRVLAKFQHRFAEDLVELERALLSLDAATVASIAHRIKGASANVAAAQLQESAAEIEQWGRAGRLEDAAGGVQRLRQQWTQFAHQASALDLSAGDVP